MFASSGTAQTPRSARHFLGVIGSIAAMAFCLHGGSARAAGQAPDTPPTKASSSDGKSTLETVTIEARKQLERQVSHFVSSVVVHYLHDSLVRWDAPICPLVAGLARGPRRIYPG